MSEYKTITLSESLDLAVEKMGRRRRRVMTRRLKSDRYREAVLDELAEKLSSCPKCAAMGVSSAFGSDDFTPATQFRVPIGDFESFLDAILAALPQILEFVMLLLPLFIGLIVMASMLSLSSPAMAGETRLCGIPVPEGTDMSLVLERLDFLEERVSALEQAPLVEAPKPAPPKPTPPKPTPVVVAPAAAPVLSSVYVGRWGNNDGRSRRDHAVIAHGFDPSLSDSELARLHDAYHDQYGSGTPSNTRTRTRTVVRASNCPGGICPAPSFSRTVSSSGGWYLGKRFGR